MADQIKKIIFTTKEAYEKKVAAGTLDPEVVYAIDASQVVTGTEVKKAVDDGFNEFPLKLGLDGEAAKFYKIPIGLTDIFKEMIGKLFNVRYNNDTVVRYGNGTKQFNIDIIKYINKSSLKAIQDGTDYGFVKFEVLEETVGGVLTKVTIPNSVDITREFKLKAASIFNATSITAKIKPSFEADMIEMLNYLHNKVNFAKDLSIARFKKVDNSYQIDNVFIYFKDISKFQPNVLNGSVLYHAIFPDNADVSNIYNTFLLDGNTDDVEKFRLITNIGFTKYVDIPTGTWKDFPESIKPIYNKFATRYQDVVKLVDDERNLRIKANDILKSINFSSVSVHEFLDSDKDLSNSDVIIIDDINSNNLVDILTKANEINPLKAKIIYISINIINNDKTLKKISEYPSIKAIYCDYYRNNIYTDLYNLILFSKNDVKGMIDGKLTTISNDSLDITVPTFDELKKAHS